MYWSEVHRIHVDPIYARSTRAVVFGGTDGRNLRVTVRFDSDDHAYVELLGAPGLHLTTEIRETPHA